jgi:5-methylthioribose kinase
MQEFLDESNVFAYLQRRHLLDPGVGARLSSPGEGNINWVRRIEPRVGRSFVLKQARPALERFPEYRVSTERIVFEARYYEIAAPLDEDGLLPEIIDFDPEQRVLVLEDLAAAERLDHALARGGDVADALARLARLLGAVHAHTRDASLAARFENDDMRRLHGEHIFLLPYRDNGFPASDAVRAAAARVWADTDLVATIDASYARYLEPRGALVHADVQPGNVLLDGARPVLLDAEIAHVGDPAFDVGTLLAHVALAGLSSAALDVPALWQATWAAYARAHGEAGRCGFEQAARYAGIEMLRRTIGAARVAAIASDTASLAAIDAGRRLVSRPPASPRAFPSTR